MRCKLAKGIEDEVLERAHCDAATAATLSASVVGVVLRPAFRPGSRERGGAASAADDSAEWKVWVVESVVTSRLLARQDLLDAVEHFRRDDRLEVTLHIDLPLVIDDST